MTVRPASSGLPLVLLLAASCEGAGRQAEIDCQQRIVEAAGALRPTGANPLAGSFSHAREQLERLPRQGCTRAQLEQAALTARAAGRVAAAAERVGMPADARRWDPAMRGSEDFLRLQDEVERYQRRVQVLGEELERMAVAPPG